MCSNIRKFGRLFNVLTQLWTFFERFNDSSSGFPYGFCTFSTFPAWFSAWFGEIRRWPVLGRLPGGCLLGNFRKFLTSATICPHLGPNSTLPALPHLNYDRNWLAIPAKPE